MSKQSRNSAPPLRIGVLGCARIAQQFVRDVADSPAVRVVAAASRDAAKAADFAARFGLARHHASYEALLADDGVDAVYLPLPNSLHAEWAIAAARSGKHVLCEKPLALNLGQAQAMFDAAAAAGVMLLEAYPFYFQPQTGDMLALLRAGAIGELRSAQATFGFNLGESPGNIRLDPTLGGGALLDAGCYALSLLRLAFGEAPVRVQADASWSASGVDLSLTATLHFRDGRRAQLACAMDQAYHRRAILMGSTGTIETEYLNHTSEQSAGHRWGYLPSELRLRRGTVPGQPFEAIRSGCGSGFRFAAEAFARVVTERDFAAIARAAEASLDIAATLDALGRSARLGEPAAVLGRGG